VLVVGVPTISIDIGVDTVDLSYVSGSGTAALDFTYEINGETGQIVMANPTTITGSIHDVAPGDYGLQVDTDFVPPAPLPMVE
jgi:hypothetical protein